MGRPQSHIICACCGMAGILASMDYEPMFDTFLCSVCNCGIPGEFFDALYMSYYHPDMCVKVKR